MCGEDGPAGGVRSSFLAPQCRGPLRLLLSGLWASAVVGWGLGGETWTSVNRRSRSAPEQRRKAPGFPNHPKDSTLCCTEARLQEAAQHKRVFGRFGKRGIVPPADGHRNGRCRRPCRPEAACGRTRWPLRGRSMATEWPLRPPYVGIGMPSQGTRPHSHAQCPTGYAWRHLDCRGPTCDTLWCVARERLHNALWAHGPLVVP